MILAFEPHGFLSQAIQDGVEVTYLFPPDLRRSSLLSDNLSGEIEDRLNQLQFDPAVDEVYLVGIFPACIRLVALLVARYGKDSIRCSVWDPSQSSYRSMRF